MSRQDDDNQSYCAKNAQQDGRLRAAQLKMLAMLKVVDQICQQLQLDYWLEGGTLLGAVRHQDFIPWDDDMDISMPRASFEAFIQKAPSLLPANILLQTCTSDPGYFNLAVPLKIRDTESRFIEMHEQGNETYQQGIFIDVFVYDHLPPSKLQRTCYKFLAKKARRLLRHKYCPIAMGHYAVFYQLLGRFISKTALETLTQKLIHSAKNSNSPYVGYGYDCVNSNVVKLDDIYPLRRTQFGDAQFNIPHRAEVLLTQLYGDYLSLPPEHERVMKHCRELAPFYGQQAVME